MATISSLGTGSGLDLQGILSKLMTVESQPLSMLSNKQSGLQSKVSAYGALQGTLSALQITAQTLATASTFTSAGTSLSDSTIMSASASSGAAAGSYKISVGQLAQGQVLRSNTNYASISDTFNTGNIAISVGGVAATNITIDISNNTLSGIRDAINTANAGVTASVINDGTTNRLLLASNSTGLTAGAISVSVTDAGSGGSNALSGLDSASLVQTQEPLDAQFSINGLNISRSSNTVSDAIDNLTFTLNKAGTIASPVTTQLTVSKNTASIQSSITSFITAYNGVIKQIKSFSGYDATSNKASVLTGDGTLRNIRSQLTNTLLLKVSGLEGGISVLSDIGIAVQKDGTLAADSAKLQAALADTNKDVAGLFSSTNGIAVNLKSLLDSLVGTTGIISSRVDGINKSIKDITNQQTALSFRLTKIEASYRAQFAALDSTISSMQGTQSYMTQQLDYIKAIATGVSTSSNN